jgi:tetratricopeptide (TPR) repeat protein
LGEDFPAHTAGLRPGSLLAGYELEAQVGVGGMATVFRARDQRLGRLVALKVMAPALVGDQEFRRRFIAESRAAALVDDPHIIPVYEAGEADGMLFIAMRFIRGGDLRQVLALEGPLPPGRVAAFISPVASALDAAHRAGLVHRDVKPANILVDAHADRPDHVYLSDFGVSKGAASSVSLTAAGSFLGTPDYSAPEQIQGRSVDGRSDQYALACVAYELLTGAVPFERDQGMAVMLAHLSDPPPALTARRPGLPTAADQVVGRAMAKVADKRYGSCRDFAEALREALGLMPYLSAGTSASPGHPPTEVSAPPAFPATATVPSAAAEADRGDELCEQKRYAEAEAAYRTAIGLDHELPRAHSGLGRALVELKRYPEAEAALRQAIRLDPDLSVAHAELGRVLGRLRRFPEAEAACREAIRLDPDLARAHSNLGAVLTRVKRYQEAEAALREAIRLDPGLAAAQAGFGILLLTTKRLAEAEGALREAIRLDPSLAAAHTSLGLYMLYTKRLPEAESALREAIRLDPDMPAAHLSLGRYLLSAKRRQEAEAEFREAIRLDPALAQAHSHLGLVLCDAKQYEPAEAALTEAIRLNPALTEAHAGLGEVLRNTGRYQEAESALREAISLDPPPPRPTTVSVWSCARPSGTKRPRPRSGPPSSSTWPSPTPTTGSAWSCATPSGMNRPRPRSPKPSAWTRPLPSRTTISAWSCGTPAGTNRPKVRCVNRFA